MDILCFALSHLLLNVLVKNMKIILTTFVKSCGKFIFRSAHCSCPGILVQIARRFLCLFL